jgi:hypothetical protein
VFGKLHGSFEYLDPICRMQKAVQVHGLDVGLAAGYRYSRKGRAIESSSHYCPNAKEFLDVAIAKFENAKFPYLDAVSRCSKISWLF